MSPRYRTAVVVAIVALVVVAVAAAAWLLLIAVPDLIDRHRDGALAAAIAVLAAVPAGLVWGATRLVHALRDTIDD